jgi:hypothetical protein
MVDQNGYLSLGLFLMDAKALRRQVNPNDQGSSEWVSDGFMLSAVVQIEDSIERWGVLLKHLDPNGNIRAHIIEYGNLHRRSFPIIAQLASAGLRIGPTKHTLLLDYLARARPAARLLLEHAATASPRFILRDPKVGPFTKDQSPQDTQYGEMLVGDCLEQVLHVLDTEPLDFDPLT